MRLFVAVFICLYGFSLPILGSNDDSSKDITLLKTVTIEHVKSISFQQILPEQQIGVSNTILTNTIAQIRNYGPSQISTLSLRGLGSQHTALLWNGINATNAAHGSADVSLWIPYSLLSTSKIQYGVPGNTNGNNSVAGTLQNDTKVTIFEPNSQFRFVMQQGSFQSATQYAGYRYSNKNIQFGIEAFHENSLNTFSFKSNPLLSKPDRKTTHARMQQYQAQGMMAAKFKSYHMLYTQLYFVQANRQIPAALHEASSDALQLDRQWKSMLAYDYSKSNITVLAKLAWFSDKLHFSSNKLQIESQLKLQTINAQVHAIYKIRKNEIQIKAENQNVHAVSNNYTSKPVNQNIVSFFANYIFKSTHFNFAGELKQMWIDSKASPFLFNSSITIHPVKNLFFTVKGARVFRYATLNDLYWANSVNSNLQDEKGWNMEYAIQYKVRKKKWSFQTHAGNYYYWITNWIQWTPTALGNWTPSNTKKVFSRGIELNSGITYTGINSRIHTAIMYSYTLPQQSSDGPLYGKILIYEAQHRALINTEIQLWGLLINYAFQYTSQRYTSSDNTYSLLGFSTHDIRCSYKYTANKITLEPFISARNLLNKSYMMMQGRPMPGIQFQGGILVSFDNKQSLKS